MAAGYYQFLLFPKHCTPILGEEGWEIRGENVTAIEDIEEVLLSILKVDRYIPSYTWPGRDARCYYKYDDGTDIIEIEINCGDYKEFVQEISVRFKLRENGLIFKKTLDFCRDLSRGLNLNVLDMRMSKMLDFEDEELINQVYENYKKAY
ncbi:MAG: hypothetical protein ACM3UU_11795 [Ignavibacteriales bacterium]